MKYLLTITLIIASLSIRSEVMGQKDLAREWLRAVNRNQEDRAIVFADKLLKNWKPGTREVYSSFSEENGIKKSFLYSGFNSWDMQCWKHALFFQQLSIRACNGNPDDAVALFRTVVEHHSLKDDKDFKIAPWPFNVWTRKYGLCDRLCWVFCEMAYQCGWQAQIIYLIDTEKKLSDHTICEIRKGKKVLTADPYFGRIMACSVHELQTDKKLALKMWPDQESCREHIKTAVYFTPSYPQDFCERNQALASLLARINPRMPIFGEEPQLRRIRYRQLMSEGTPASLQLWDFPFRILHLDMTLSGNIEFCLPIENLRE